MTLDLPGWAVVTPERAAHIGRVAALLERWARERGVPAAEADRWRRAAVLHDALRDAGPDELARWAPRGDWPAAVWHGPAAAAAAERNGETDAGVLAAVRYHSVGHADWDEAGRMLYLADYLEPARTRERERRDAWIARVAGDAAAVLREVAGHRLTSGIARGLPIHRNTWEFWNRLVASGSSSPA